MNINDVAYLIDKIYTEPHSTLIKGLLLGIKLDRTTQFYRDIKNAGLLHLVVLSGSNISMLVTILNQLTKFINRKISLVINISVIIWFINFINPEPPIVRATIMSLITNIFLIFDKKIDGFYSLMASAVFISLFKPDWISTISFQLSFFATFGVILISNINFGAQKEYKNIIDKIIDLILENIKISIGAQIFVVPIIWIYFKEFNLNGLISTLLVSWAIAPIMILTTIGIIIYNIGPKILSLIPIYGSFSLVNFIIWIIKLFSHSK